MARRPRFPDVVPEYFALRGGLDLVSPKISIDPGKLFDVQNYEPATAGGYRRINGFERFDGRTAPSDASYWVIAATVTSSIAAAATVTGLSSGATGKVLLAATTSSTELVLGRVSGTFQNGEALQVSAVTVATSGGLALENGASDPEDHVDWRLLAADDRRADITTVTGSGDIRGGFTFEDTQYVFRDNAGGTAGTLWKHTAAGWSQVTFPYELQFDGAVGEITAGQTVTGLTSGASAVVVRAMLRTGTWTVSGVGTLIFASITSGPFQDNEAIQVGGLTKVTANGASNQITRAAGGRIEAVVDNFTGSTATRRVYGVDGVNPAFEFDGTYYVPIRTGMTTDTPTHIAVHRNRLFVTFLGSLQYSGVGQPYSWTLLTGANEIGMGDTITGIKPVAGSDSGAALAVFTVGKTSILYGSSSSDFTLVPSRDEIGYEAYTLQEVGNDIFGLTSNGIQSLRATQSFGNYQYAAISFLIEPLLKHKRDQGILPTASVSLKAKNQYRLFFDDGSCIVVGLTGNKVSGITTLNYPVPVLCAWTGKLTTGEEVCFFGSDDGYVYKDSVGTSFDGEPIESWARLAFNNSRTPQVRKHYKRAVFEVECEGFARVNGSYDLGYGTPNVAPAAVQEDQTLTGEGGYWDHFIWNEFTWDSPVVSQAHLSIDGAENNVSPLFYSNRAEDDPHMVQGVTLLYILRRIVHSGS